MKKFLPAKSKKGITLVESVIAVVVLALLAAGVLSMLVAGNAKISEFSAISLEQAEATRLMDQAIAAVSNGSYIDKTGVNPLLEDYPDDEGNLQPGLKTALGIDNITFEIVYYEDYVPNELSQATMYDVRGWYITLTYKGITLKGFVANAGGAFDSL